MCSDIVGGKYTITPQTVDRAVELVKYLMAKYGIDVDHVVRHYDVTGKLCPEPWVRDESLWRKFKARLTAPVEPEPKKEDDEVVERKRSCSTARPTIVTSSARMKPTISR